MKRTLIISMMIVLLSFSVVSYAIVTNSSEYSNVKVYVFYNEENEAYQQEKNYLDENVNIRKEYINTNENEELFTKVKATLKIRNNKFPVLVIGSTYFTGFNEKIQNNIKEAEEAYENAEKYGDIVEKIRNNEDVKDVIKQNEEIYKNSNSINVILMIILIIFVIGLITFSIYLRKNKKTSNKFSQ